MPIPKKVLKYAYLVDQAHGIFSDPAFRRHRRLRYRAAEERPLTAPKDLLLLAWLWIAYRFRANPGGVAPVASGPFRNKLANAATRHGVKKSAPSRHPAKSPKVLAPSDPMRDVSALQHICYKDPFISQ